MLNDARLTRSFMFGLSHIELTLQTTNKELSVAKGLCVNWQSRSVDMRKAYNENEIVHSCITTQRNEIDDFQAIVLNRLWKSIRNH